MKHDQHNYMDSTQGLTDYHAMGIDIAPGLDLHSKLNHAIG